MVFKNRRLTPNEPFFIRSDNPWGPRDGKMDDCCVLLRKEGRRCVGCRRVVLNKHIKEKEGEPYCPDCFKK